MVTVLHRWVTRVYCPGCETFSWTNPGAGSVLCLCGVSEIRDDVVVSGDPVTDETAFAQAVADDLQIDVADLLLQEV
jgi:hypothetical protein